MTVQPLPPMSGYHRVARADEFERVVHSLGGKLSARDAVLTPDCLLCPHEWAEHWVIGLHFDVMYERELPIAGVILCPRLNCACRATWSIGFQGHNYERPEMPEDAFIEALRREVQARRS